MTISRNCLFTLIIHGNNALTLPENNDLLYRGTLLGGFKSIIS